MTSDEAGGPGEAGQGEAGEGAASPRGSGCHSDRRVALVTGASRGLGAAIAQRLAQDGHAVVVNYASSAGAADDVVRRIRAGGGTALAVRADVTDEDGVRALVDTAREELGEVTTLVLNATGPQPTAPLDEVGWQHVVDQLAFFVKSPLLLTRAVLPGMRRAGWGRIVHIGSDSVDRAPAGNTSYVAAKSAQLGMARVWARELGPDGITVNTVAPGWVPVERHAGVDPDELEEYAAKVPLRRMGTPRDVADAVAYLASDAASFVTGAYLSVNGGTTAR